MTQKKPALIGRLAVQLKLITPQQLVEAVTAQRPDQKLGEVLLAQGLVDDRQLAKLVSVQRDLVEKHRARQSAAGGGAAAASPRPAAQRTAAPAPDGAAVHGAATRALHDAAPVTQEVVREIAEPPPAAARPAPPPATDAATGSGTAARPPQVPAVPPAAPDQATPAPAPSGDGPASLELVLPEPDAAAEQQLHRILAAAIEAGASDVHIHGEGALELRVAGELGEHGGTQFDRETAGRLVAAALDTEQRAELCRDGELDFCLDLEGVGRFRANAYRQQRGFDVVLRSIPATPPTLEELGLPTELAKLTDFHQGMVLLTGPAGCGKSATLAAMLNLINENREEHILTVEDPIEVIHPPKGCLVNQRHAGKHTQSFARALRGALREDPDVIVIGELRDLETISLAMTAAETGHFVLATLHTNNAVRTINRLIGAFPSNEQAQVRAMLSVSLRAVVSQRLVPRADGSGRVPALELLRINKAIGNLIRDEKTIQIRSSMQTGRAQGMYLLEQSLNDLVASGQITRETALRFAEEEKLITAGR